MSSEDSKNSELVKKRTCLQDGAPLALMVGAEGLLAGRDQVLVLTLAGHLHTTRQWHSCQLCHKKNA
jgi:hypothetical protein